MQLNEDGKWVFGGISEKVLKDVDEGVLFPCQECYREFESPEDLEVHLQEYHGHELGGFSRYAITTLGAKEVVKDG